MTIPNRIEGWTQDDEDRTFGLNGYERVYKGTGEPTFEEQRVVKQLRTMMTEKLRAAKLRGGGLH